MPPPLSARAPYFTGSHNESMEEFLTQFNETADIHKLTSQQKVEKVVRYTSKTLADFWKSLDGYINRDWYELQRALRRIYATIETERYTKPQLYEFVRESASKPIKKEGDVVTYYQRFLMISKPLLDARKLTIEERDEMFWHGLSPESRHEILPRFMLRNPIGAAADIYAMEDVYDAARETYAKNRFKQLFEPQTPKPRTSEEEHRRTIWPEDFDLRPHERHRRLSDYKRRIAQEWQEREREQEREYE
jgi:hypothetical protein